jgi:4-oxalocrotonate tautomerase family enzyme
MFKDRTLDQKRKLVRAITDDMVKILKVEPEWVTIFIEELEMEHWSEAGVLHSDKMKKKSKKSGKLKK